MNELYSPLVNASRLVLKPERVKLVIRSGNLALVIRKTDGLWDLPGGRCAPSETPVATLSRELMEETGMAMSHIKHLGDHLRLRGARSPVYVAFFGARLPSGLSIDALTLSTEHDQAQLISLSELYKYNMPELYAVMIQHWLGDSV